MARTTTPKAPRSAALTAARKQLTTQERSLQTYQEKLDAAWLPEERAQAAEMVKHYTHRVKKCQAAVETALALTLARATATEPAFIMPSAQPAAPRPDVHLSDDALRAVLQPRPAGPALRSVEPVEYAAGSLQERIVCKAAAQLRAIYNASPDRRQHDCYQSACAENAIASLELAEALADEREAAIALAVFRRALPANPGEQRPTAPRALAQMQMLAVDAARKVRLLFAEQQGLAFA